MFTMSSKKFTIDDAFDTEEDDVIRIYGSTTESTPLKPKSSPFDLKDDGVIVRIEDPSRDFNRSSKIKHPDDALSRDSDSLIHNDFSSHKFDTREYWWKHPKVRDNWKVMLAAFALLVIGIGLLVTGFVVHFLPEIGIQGFVFFIAGAICFIPGAYHVVYVYLAVKGKRGYDFYNLPLFN